MRTTGGRGVMTVSMRYHCNAFHRVVCSSVIVRLDMKSIINNPKQITQSDLLNPIKLTQSLCTNYNMACNGYVISDSSGGSVLVLVPIHVMLIW